MLIMSTLQLFSSCLLWPHFSSSVLAYYDHTSALKFLLIMTTLQLFSSCLLWPHFSSLVLAYYDHTSALQFLLIMTTLQLFSSCLSLPHFSSSVHAHHYLTSALPFMVTMLLNFTHTMQHWFFYYDELGEGDGVQFCFIQRTFIMMSMGKAVECSFVLFGELLLWWAWGRRWSAVLFHSENFYFVNQFTCEKRIRFLPANTY